MQENVHSKDLFIVVTNDLLQKKVKNYIFLACVLLA